MASDAAVRITVGGTDYTVRFADLTAIDAKDFRAAVGVSLAQALNEGSADLDVVAGLIWLTRRKRERGLAYAKVAKELTYADDLAFEEPDQEDTSDPEA